MSIETVITTLAKAIETVGQAGFALATSLDRYCDIAQGTATKAETTKPTPKAEQETPAPSEVAPAETDSDDFSEVEDVAEESTEAAPVETDKEYSYDDVKSVVIDSVTAKGKTTVANILAEFGAKNAKEIDPSQYGAFVAKLKAA